VFRVPLVLASEDDTRLAFALRSPYGSMLETPKQFEKAAQGRFVSGGRLSVQRVLIHRRVIESVCLPLAGMFIWADESEYLLRAKRAGYRVATIARARFHHPLDRMEERSFSFLGRQLWVMHVDNPL
jgi:rhamnopyranosyl-N-acetylglucosaminyl-diphospho-decaprenol beta-1,3/1,4-galactofuranosyltransferase